MSITIEEKEALFKEFEARLADKQVKERKKQGYASGYATLHNLEPAKDYFKKRFDQMHSDFAFDIWTYHGLMWSDWDKIRMLVSHTYGISLVKNIPEDRLEAANNLAIAMIDLIFEQNYETLNKLKEIKENEES